MSVLISGINKSTNCKDCIFCVNDWCVINSRLHHIKGAEETTQYCPLIELPPHGRLIDADALHIDLMDRGIADIQTSDWYEIRQAVADAPTIIEAEGER